MKTRTISAAVTLAMASTLLSGCLVMTGKSIDESGTKISGSTLSQITPGETTEAWLVATLGEPSERTSVEGLEDVKVLRYDYVVTKARGGTVFLIFAGGSETVNTTRTYFEVERGVIQRYWSEK